MIRVIGRVGLALAVLALCAVGTALAQDNLQAGMTPVQLYTADCAICHKSPHALIKGRGFYSLDSYLQVHYTASRESAAAIARYLVSLAGESAPKRERVTRTHKAKPASPSSKPVVAKPAVVEKSPLKPPATMPSEAKSSKNKPSEKKASADKPVTPKPSETKTSETKTSETKAPAAKKSTAKDVKAGKDDKPEKAD